MKKIIVLLLAMMLVISGCAQKAEAPAESDNTPSETPASSEETPQEDPIKVGVIYVGDENEGYTEAHMMGIQDMKTQLGLSDDQIIEKTHIGEDESAYDAAVDLADQGCDIIFANSFGHEDYMIQAAKEFPEVQFAHATGYQAALSELPNMHNYFTAVYESRYVSGIVAGLKINELIANGEITADEAKIGYVGAYPYAEVVSGYTSFYLGAKSVCPTATMEVQYTNSWADMSAESEVATQLISNGAVLISQHADTTGAPTAAQDAGAYVVGYNVDMTSVAPDAALTSATINWGPYYTYAVDSVMEGTEIATDWCQGYVDAAVGISPLNDAVVAEGTSDAVDAAVAGIIDGSVKVFDTTTFTIGGKTLEDLIANDEAFKKYSPYVSDGYFHESEIVSAPAFDLRIDGITELN